MRINVGHCSEDGVINRKPLRRAYKEERRIFKAGYVGTSGYLPPSPPFRCSC